MERRWCMRIAHKERIELYVDKQRAGLASIRNLSHTGTLVDSHPSLAMLPIGAIVILSFNFIPSFGTYIHIPSVLVRKDQAGTALMFLNKTPYVARSLEKIFESDKVIESIRAQARKERALAQDRRTDSQPKLVAAR